MSMARFTLPAAILLAGCVAGPPESSLPDQPPPRPSLVGRGVAGLALDTAAAALARQRAALAEVLPGAEFYTGTDGALRVRLDPDDFFESRSAQLRTAALTACAEAAAVLQSMEGSVVHVLAYGPAGEDPAATLAARRAASVMDYLARRGIVPTRLRAEGRAATDGAERLELVLKPVVQGREAQAWAPPTDG